MIGRQFDLFDDSGWCPPSALSAELKANHYLGPINRGFGYRDEYGCLVLSSPTSRRLPLHWLELSRWCLNGSKNGGSRQWATVRKLIKTRFPDCTTVVSYSDPSQGHTGALYRACGWKWAPTWHRIVTPPTGNGSWTDGTTQSAKDRWVCLIRRDKARRSVLAIDESYANRFPFCAWSERDGADFKGFREAL
jgi:hypothetical protein